jgi:hypothetical protein
MDFKHICIAIASDIAISHAPSHASGHGPLFSLVTPTNPQGGWSFDTSFMGRYGALPDVNNHPPAVNIGDFETLGLFAAQSGPIQGREQSAMLQVCCGV